MNKRDLIDCPELLPEADLNDAAVFLTGATGSFGRSFVRYVVARFKPRRFIIFSRDELKQYEMAQEFPTEKYPFLRYFIGDVRDEARLEMAMQDVEVVVHAAAMKHVPIAEYNPFECIHTNVMGAENVVRTAIRCGVRKVVALSTDKAVNPVNLYGASKLASDKIFVAGNNMGARIGTTFSVVRYGNVVGSRGSVVLLFRKLIRDGAKRLPITDPRMTRFWITVDEGVRLVLWAISNMQGGEIVVPKIPSIRIADLATAMAPDLEHEVIGIRPGEKLHEVLITEEDARQTLDLGDRYIIEPAFDFWGRNSFPDGVFDRVPQDFRYASETNDWWLGVDDLSASLEISTGETVQAGAPQGSI